MNEEPGQIPDTEDIFKQLSETNFEIDNFLSEFNTNDIKVSMRAAFYLTKKKNGQRSKNSVHS